MMKDYFEIEAVVEMISGAAILVNSAEKSGWIPKSLIEGYNDDSFFVGDLVVFSVETWFLEQENWI